MTTTAPRHAHTECFYCYRKAVTVVTVPTIRHPEGEPEARCTRHRNGG